MGRLTWRWLATPMSTAVTPCHTSTSCFSSVTEFVQTGSDDKESKGVSHQDTAASLTPPLVLTPSCVSQLQKLRQQGISGTLRVAVEGGGCSGFNYCFELDNNPPSDEDVVISEGEHARVLVDRDSLELVRGAQLDYQSELIRSGFKIVKNPLAEKSCSCGSSFALRMD